ncbi:8661_t:CDS:2, partial [Dentiscutata erythropus]
MISSVQIEELNKAIEEVAALYSQKIREIVDRIPASEDPYWRLSDLQELTKIKNQLNLLFKIRDNCVQVLEDLELLKDMADQQPNRPHRTVTQHQRSLSQPDINPPAIPARP